MNRHLTKLKKIPSDTGNESSEQRTIRTSCISLTMISYLAGLFGARLDSPTKNIPGAGKAARSG